jgi:spore coat polysaccharide biosynthesis protein SpsF (cytidylyltransferase family)
VIDINLLEAVANGYLHQKAESTSIIPAPETQSLNVINTSLLDEVKSLFEQYEQRHYVATQLQAMQPHLYDPDPEEQAMSQMDE